MCTNQASVKSPLQSIQMFLYILCKTVDVILIILRTSMLIFSVDIGIKQGVGGLPLHGDPEMSRHRQHRALHRRKFVVGSKTRKHRCKAH